VSGHAIAGGDALLIQNEDRLKFEAGEDAEVLVFDLAP
jgi:redox-sensitive bicupin YhaK (pirin superfamily)